MKKKTIDSNRKPVQQNSKDIQSAQFKLMCFENQEKIGSKHTINGNLVGSSSPEVRKMNC